MSVKIEVCRVFAAEPAVVWARIARIEDHSVWMKDAVRIEPRAVPRRDVGDEFDCLTRVGPFSTNDRFTVTEWAPPAVMGIDHVGAVKGTARFVLEPAGDNANATRFCWRESLTFPWWMGGALGGSVAKHLLAKIWRANLVRLQRLVEAPEPSVREAGIPPSSEAGPQRPGAGGAESGE